MNDIDKARENYDRDYLDKSNREWNDIEADNSQHKSDVISDIAYEIFDGTDDMLYDIRHHDGASLLADISRIANMDFDDVDCPSDITLTDEFDGLLTALRYPFSKHDFHHSINELKKVHNTFKKNEDSTLFLKATD